MTFGQQTYDSDFFDFFHKNETFDAKLNITHLASILLLS